MSEREMRPGWTQRGPGRPGDPVHSSLRSAGRFTLYVSAKGGEGPWKIANWLREGRMTMKGPATEPEAQALAEQVAVEAMTEGLRELAPERLAEDTAAMRALDAIAKACGCPQWDYPGQVVRDVQSALDEYERLAQQERRLTDAESCGCGRRLLLDGHPLCPDCRAAVAVEVERERVIRAFAKWLDARARKEQTVYGEDALEVAAALVREGALTLYLEADDG